MRKDTLLKASVTNCESALECRQIEDTSRHSSKAPNSIQDISQAVGKSLSDEEKYNILVDKTQPSQDYRFPEVIRYGRKRSFLRKWLSEHSWLSYSVVAEGAYCKVCVLFAVDMPSLNQFVKSPLMELEKGNAACRNHSTKEYHQFAMERAVNFKATYENREKSIVSQLDKKNKEMTKIMHDGVTSIACLALFLGKQGQPFRGHRNEELAAQNLSLYQQDTISSSFNSGMFLELVKLTCRKDEALKRHLELAPRNRKYLSKYSQNRMLLLLGKQTKEYIINEIKQSKQFSLMLDECTDASTKEQMAVVVRYCVEANGTINVKERFLELVECDTGTTGQAIADKVEAVITSLGLDSSGFRAITTDGAGNMSGKYRGAATLLQERFPGLCHIHCYSHVLNLAIVKACKLQSVQNMMESIKSIHYFFEKSAKRHAALAKVIESADMPELK